MNNVITFDNVFNRRNTNCTKWDSIKQTYAEDDLLPLWIADMDFKADDTILTGLEKVINHGILGYYNPPESLYTAIKDWQKKYHNYSVENNSILFSSGVVPSIALTIQAFTKLGEAVLIQDPVYPPFAHTVQQNGRKLIRNKLNISNNHFEMDLVEIEKLIVSETIRLFILCNPHNPGGRVWSKNELEAIGKLCSKHHVIVVSDEIHQDLIFSPHTFTTFNNAHPSFKDFSIILTSATKTFNLAAIKNSMVFIENPLLREQFVACQQRNCQNEINVFGYAGTEIAYQKGRPWLNQLLIYLSNNIDIVQQFLAEEMPEVTMMRPEGTYLIWLDFSKLGFTDKQIQNQLIHKGKVVLNAGTTFGPNGTQHMRLNIACPKEILLEGLRRIKIALT